LPLEPSSEDRLDSWKEIAAYLKKDVTTVQRWERREGMPVHRHVHDKGGSVYAFRTELDAWSASRRMPPATESELEPERAPDLPVQSIAPRRRLTLWLLVATAGVLLSGLTLWQLARGNGAGQNPLTGARFQQLTNFGGMEQAAALSRDGKFVTFVSDRDGRMDVWVSQIGTGQFYNLTRGAAPELVNPSVRTLGFSPDGTVVTFWARKSGGSGQADIGIWASPVLGGAARPYLEGVAEFDWSSDGARLVYHTPGPGDPMFVRDRDGQARQIFSAPPGLHAHFPIWSPDQSFIYFVQGTVPDRMDIWRIRPSGEAPERITTHDSRVSHPVFLDARTLLYLAIDSDGSGPSIYSIDVEQRTPQRVTFGVERYSSLASSSDGGRLVATMSSPKGTLWRLPVLETRVDSAAPRRISLTTGNGFAPRLGPDFLLYITSKGESDGIWKLKGDVATEIWSAAETRITGAPAISRDGSRIAFVAQRNRRTSLYLANADGTNARVLTSSLQLQGAPSWTPDEQSIAVAAVVDGSPRVFSVPVDGSAPRRLIDEHSVDPVWSPDGDLLVYSGPDIGTTFPVKVVTAGAYTDSRSILTLSRGSRHVAFMPGGRLLLVLRGEIGHKDLWLIDLATGDERQLTRFAPGFNVRDVDISPDGREIVVEQVQEHSDIVLIDLLRR
jgi:Tol biopolymer transport system component